MREHKTAAIILHTADVYDADRSYLLFTREFGKVWARAKGVRRTTSRLTGHLLQFVPTDLELVDTSTGSTLIVQAQVSGGQTAEHYPGHTLPFLHCAEVLSEAVDILFVEREAHVEVYDGLVYTIEELHTLCTAETVDDTRLRLVVAELLFKMLTVLGYRPELGHCAITGNPLSSDWVGWSSIAGGVVNKEATQSLNTPVNPVISPQSIVVLRQFARPEFVASRLSVESTVAEEASALVFDYLQTQINKPLRSLPFLAAS